MTWELSKTNIPLVSLGEIVRGCDFAMVRNLDHQLQNIFGRERENPLIEKFFHFQIAGAYPHSEELAEGMLNLVSAGYLRKITGEEIRLVYPSCYETAERNIKPQLSKKEYEFLVNIGKEVDGVDRYKLIK